MQMLESGRQAVLREVLHLPNIQQTFYFPEDKIHVTANKGDP